MYKELLRQLDHDCEGVECTVCCEIEEMTEEEAKLKWEEVQKDE